MYAVPSAGSPTGSLQESEPSRIGPRAHRDSRCSLLKKQIQAAAAGNGGGGWGKRPRHAELCLRKTISEPLRTQDIPGTVSLAFVPWKARESALLRVSPLCESVQTRSLQLPLASPPSFFSNSWTLGTRYSSSTHTRSFTLAQKISGLELLLGGGRD